MSDSSQLHFVWIDTCNAYAKFDHAVNKSVGVVTILTDALLWAWLAKATDPFDFTFEASRK